MYTHAHVYLLPLRTHILQAVSVLMNKGVEETIILRKGFTAGVEETINLRKGFTAEEFTKVILSQSHIPATIPV